MTTYHAVVTPTNLGTLKSARRAQEVEKPVQIVASGTVQECYDAVRRMHNAEMNCTVAEALSLPCFIDADWTYRIVADDTSGDPRQRDRTDEIKWLQDSVERSVAEWYVDVERQLERAAEAVRSRKAEMIVSIAALKAGQKPQYSGPVDIMTYTINDISNLSRNVSMDVAARRAVELALAFGGSR